jgi:hypothetical protein
MRVLILLALFPVVLCADHLPGRLIAQGEHETSLCAIEVNHSHVDELMQRFGTPAVYDKYPKVKDQAEISWDKDGARIHTYVNVDQVAYAVEVSGAPSDQDATGRGLRLGQTIADVIRIYGNRYRKRGTQVTLQWADGTELRISFEKNRIAKLMLVAPVE